MLRWVRVRAFDLNEAFRANGLVATSSAIKIRRIVKKTNWAFGGIFVQVRLNRLAIDEWIPRQLHFSRG